MAKQSKSTQKYVKKIRELIEEADRYNGTVWVSDCRTLKDEFERILK